MISLSSEQHERVRNDIKFRLTGRDSEMFASHLLYAFVMPDLGKDMGLYVPKNTDENNTFFINPEQYGKFIGNAPEELRNLDNKLNWVKHCESENMNDYDCYSLRNGIFISSGQSTVFFPIRSIKLARIGYNVWGARRVLVTTIMGLQHFI
jgi:hypothetical protein